MKNPIHADLLRQLIPIVRAGAEVVMDVYATDFVIYGKDDTSPVTIADQRAEAIMLPELRKLLPGVPIIAEEEVAAGRVPDIVERFWLVDPLDGTKEFISRRDEFTVNVALVEHGMPVLGVVMAPASGKLFSGASECGAFLHDGQGSRAIHCRRSPKAGLTVMMSRSHGNMDAVDAFLSDQKVAEVKRAGSSLKLCLIAAGEADIYPRLGLTMEWDTAAGHAVLLAAGGQIVDMEGRALAYGKAGFGNPYFIAHGLAS